MNDLLEWLRKFCKKKKYIGNFNDFWKFGNNFEQIIEKFLEIFIIAYFI